MYGEQWNKRDLRSLEHAPLDTAEKPGLPYRFFFHWEPDLLAAPDHSDRHRCFGWPPLQDMIAVANLFGRVFPNWLDSRTILYK